MRGRWLVALSLGFLCARAPEPAVAQEVDRFEVCKDRKTKKFVACPELIADPNVVPAVGVQPGGRSLLEAKVELLRMLRPDLADDLREANRLEDEAAVDVALERALYRPTIQIRGMGGPMGAVGTNVDAAVEPYANLHVRAPLTTWERGPQLEVDLELVPLQGDALGFASAQTFKALEGDLGLCQPLPRPLLFSLCGTFGAASRITADSTPVDRLPLYASVDLLFTTADGEHFVKVGIGPDQRLTGAWAATITINGRLRLPAWPKASAGIYLVVDLIRALDVALPGFEIPARDSLRVGIAAGF